MTQNFRSRLDKLEAAVTPRLPRWRPAVSVMANEATTDAEVEALLAREGIVTKGESSSWVIVRRLIDPAGGDVLPNGPYLARPAGGA